VSDNDVAVIVNTPMSGQLGSPWEGKTKKAIGLALLNAETGEGLTAAQLEALIGKHQSNLKKAADELAAAGVLQRAVPPSVNGQPGRRAQVAFAFAEGERERFEEFIEAEPPERDLPDVGSHVVSISTRDETGALWKILAQPGVPAGSALVRLLEGEPPELEYSFSGPTAVDDSLDFFEVLKAAELSPRRQVVSKSTTSREVRRTARRRREQIERSRERLGSMQTEPRSESAG